MMGKFNIPEKQRRDIPIEGFLPSGDGCMEVLCLAAGENSGWEFSPAVLKAAVPLFEGVPCLMDPLPPFIGAYGTGRKSAGTLTCPVWDETLQIITAHLKPSDPSVGKLREICDEILIREGIGTRPGFSLDMEFSVYTE